MRERREENIEETSTHFQIQNLTEGSKPNENVERDRMKKIPMSSDF